MFRDRLSAFFGEELDAYGPLLEGAQLVNAAIESDLRAATGRSLQEFEVLLHTGFAEGGIRPTTLAARCVMSSGGCTRLVDRLEEAGLVRRTSHPTDRRGQVVQLTDDGERFLLAAMPAHVESVRRHVAQVVGPDGLRALRDVMSALRAHHRDDI